MKKPNVLVIAGHDPSGGAGIHADIEAIQSLGGFASTLITGLTVQNSQHVSDFELVDIDLLRRQADALLEDMDYQAVKIGMTGSVAMVRFVAGLLERLPDVPVVLDPVLAAEAGGSLAEGGTAETVPEALMRELAPRCTLATPNLPEALALSGERELQAAGRSLTEKGCPATLITGSHDDTPGVRNHLFTPLEERHWEWERLQGSFHGSGCTLASAIAALLARGEALAASVEQAQDYVHKALGGAWQAGRGQLIPDRALRQP